MQARIGRKGKEPVNRKKRFVIVLCLYTAVFALLFCRVFYLQIIQGPSLVQRALSQWTRVTSVSAKRGDIVDRNGEVLAQSGTADTVLLYPKKIADGGADAAQNVANQLAPILGMDANTILEKAKDTTKSEIWLKRQVGTGGRHPRAQLKRRGLYGGYKALLSQRRFSDPGAGLYLRRRRGPGGYRGVL